MDLHEVCHFDFELPDGGLLSVADVRDQRYAECASPYGTVDELGDLIPVAKEVLESDDLPKISVASVSFFKDHKGRPYRLEEDGIKDAEEVVVSVRFHVNADRVQSLKKVVSDRIAERRDELLRQRDQLLAEVEAVDSLLDELAADD